MIHINIVVRFARPLRSKSFMRSASVLHPLQYSHKLSTSSRARPRTLQPHNVVLQSPLFTTHRSVSSISAILLCPVIFLGLIASLWTWKCFMMVLFQNKIIYMPFLPPNARSDSIEEYSSYCGGIRWREEHITSGDGTDIALAVTEVGEKRHREKVVLYFQGNASSLPARLPDISQVLRLLQQDNPSFRLKFIGVSYRGYWKSGGKPSEIGMHQDAEAAFQYAISSNATFSLGSTSQTGPVKVVIWGQSIGCAFASHLAANIMESSPVVNSKGRDVELETLVLETPFTSACEMLKALYPQKWLPYRYLSMFLWNRLDTVGALGRIKMSLEGGGKRLSVGNKQVNVDNKRLSVVILESEKDELVPREHGSKIERLCKSVAAGALVLRRVKVEGALHTQVLAKGSGRIAAAEAVRGRDDGAV